MSLLPAEIQRRLREYASPTWGYRKGADGAVEKQLFDGALPAGWADSPARVDEAKATPMPPKAGPVMLTPGEAASEMAAAGGIAPPYDQHAPAQLNAEIKRRTGKGMKPGTSQAEMVERLKDLDAGL